MTVVAVAAVGLVAASSAMAASPGQGEVRAVQANPDGTTSYSIYMAAPGVSARELYRGLLTQGIPGLQDPDAPAVSTMDAFSCYYGTAYAADGGKCPPAAWPVIASAGKWNEPAAICGLPLGGSVVTACSRGREKPQTSDWLSPCDRGSAKVKIMQVAVVTFDGFNELDSFIASALINRCRKNGLEAFITTPTPTVTSMNGVEVTGQRPLEFVTEAEIVLVGSGVKTRDVIADDRLISRLPLDPSRQLIGAQCSGTLVLARLGLLGDMPACTDMTSRRFVEAYGVTVLDAPFHAQGSIATAGGCLASQYLATWVMLRTLGEDAVRDVMGYVAPVGEKAETVERALLAVHAGEIAIL